MCKMRSSAFFPVAALSGALTLTAADAGLSPGVQAQDTSAATIIAVQIRKQGFTCRKVKSALRVPGVTRPDLPIWHLRCKNAAYRVQLVPNMAAKVERLD